MVYEKAKAETIEFNDILFMTGSNIPNAPGGAICGEYDESTRHCTSVDIPNKLYPDHFDHYDHAIWKWDNYMQTEGHWV